MISDLHVEKAVAGGLGLAREPEGRVVLVRGGLPGETVTAEVVAQPTNIPTKEETASSNAFTWVVVLLVLGTLVPMLTWWVFSR